MGRRKNLLLWVVEVNVHVECDSPLLTRGKRAALLVDFNETRQLR
jgi:hypothetical protein